MKVDRSRGTCPATGLGPAPHMFMRNSRRASASRRIPVHAQLPLGTLTRMLNTALLAVTRGYHSAIAHTGILGRRLLDCG